MSAPALPLGSSARVEDENRSLAKAAGLIGVATFLSRILGFVRDMVLARLFGATAAADAFFVAYRIPNLLRELFAEGSMSAAFIPVFTEYHTLRAKRDAWELASAVFTTLLTVLTLVTVLGILAAPWIVWLLAPGFHGEPSKLAMTTFLTRIMFPYLLFISLAALAMGVLNSLRAFAAPALSPPLPRATASIRMISHGTTTTTKPSSSAPFTAMVPAVAKRTAPQERLDGAGPGVSRGRAAAGPVHLGGGGHEARRVLHTFGVSPRRL